MHCQKIWGPVPSFTTHSYGNSLDLFTRATKPTTFFRRTQPPRVVLVKKLLYCVYDPKTLLVMEYVPLGSMLIYIRTHKHRLSERKLLKFSADIAEGMEYLCQRRIIHRDLAARNILVASSDTVKISDFGLAQMTGHKEYYQLKTNRELPVRWYAPETIRQWKFTFKSDIWSFGVTLWEMFSYGEEPIIDGCRDDELLQTLESGKRLRCPGTCSVCIYTHLMKKCWEEVDENRPDFSQLLYEIRELYNNS